MESLKAYPSLFVKSKAFSWNEMTTVNPFEPATKRGVRVIVGSLIVVVEGKLQDTVNVLDYLLIRERQFEENAVISLLKYGWIEQIPKKSGPQNLFV